MYKRQDQGSPFLQGILFGTAYVPRDPPTTFYIRYGDWLAIVSVAATFSVIGFSLVRRVRRADSAATSKE